MKYRFERFLVFCLIGLNIRGEINFLNKDILNFFVIFCACIIVKVKMGYNLWMGTYGNRIGKLGKIVWSQFSNKVLQITILNIDDWDRIRFNQSIFKRKFIFRAEFKIPQKGKGEEF